MTENIEVTPEQRQAVREKYGASETTPKNSSLSALGVIAAIGFIIGVVGMIVVATTESMVTLTIWSGLIGSGVTIGFLALIAYLATKAIITSRR